MKGIEGGGVGGKNRLCPRQRQWKQKNLHVILETLLMLYYALYVALNHPCILQKVTPRNHAMENSR